MKASGKFAAVLMAAVFMVAALVLVPHVSDAGSKAEAKTIAEIAAEDGRFKTLVAALDRV